MRKTISTLAISGALATGGIAGALLGVPTISGAQTDEAPTTEEAPAERRGHFVDEVLSALVADGTISQDQSDKIAAAFRAELAERRDRGERRGPHHLRRGVPHLKAAAEFLDMTLGELRTEIRSGKTLAAIAEQEGVAVDALIDALVAAADERIDAAVEAGKLDQERAEEIRSGVRERITTMVNEGPGRRGPSDGPKSDGASRS